MQRIATNTALLTELNLMTLGGAPSKKIEVNQMESILQEPRIFNLNNFSRYTYRNLFRRLTFNRDTYGRM